MDIPYLPIPVWPVAGLAGIWAALVLWQLVGRRALDVSRDRARLARVSAFGEEVDTPRVGLGTELQQAGLGLSPASFNLLRLAGVILGLLLVPALGLPFLPGVALAAAAWWGSRAWLRGRTAGRGRKIDQELPTALARIAALLDIERDMPALLLAAADGLTATNSTSPLAAELRRTASDLRSRGPAALADLEARAPSPALANLAFSLQVFLESGGEQARLMAEAAERMHRLIQGRNMAWARAASALTVAKMFPLLLLGASLFIFQDPAIRAFYLSLAGQVLLLVIAAVMAFGYLFIKKMIEDVA